MGSYDRRAPLKQILQAFVGRIGLPMPDRFHGGVLAYGLRDPVVGNLFVVGDAAGQCLPASGEGIRPSVEAAQICGYILAKVFRGYPLFRSSAAADRVERPGKPRGLGDRNALDRQLAEGRGREDGCQDRRAIEDQAKERKVARRCPEECSPGRRRARGTPLCGTLCGAPRLG
ncbi:NAD(P)/FAD-dependent oxidoreductase [Limnochorda pilosa]|uniref:NAD(P)/FAD-dependent oxidoreductase n=1 Tax=Limnochorda pilosa TaxID=1555112 RepID=UPI0008351F38|nr:hypothetical protein [Limnochorda pilosa]